MKPDNVSSVFLACTNSTSTSSLLFQCASFFSTQGVKVLYISSTPFDKLPPGIHGMPQPNSCTIGQIRFLYLPHYQDLLKHLFSIHLHAQIPRIILVERLDNFCHLSSSEKYDHEVHCTKICAALLDATSVCAKSTKSETALVASYEVSQGQGNTVNMLIDNFFNSVAWVIEKIPTSESGRTDVVSMQLLTCPSSKNHVRLEYKSSDESLILEKVIHLTGIKV